MNYNYLPLEENIAMRGIAIFKSEKGFKMIARLTSKVERIQTVNYSSPEKCIGVLSKRIY